MKIENSLTKSTDKETLEDIVFNSARKVTIKHSVYGELVFTRENPKEDTRYFSSYSHRKEARATVMGLLTHDEVTEYVIE